MKTTALTPVFLLGCLLPGCALAPAEDDERTEEREARASVVTEGVQAGCVGSSDKPEPIAVARVVGLSDADGEVPVSDEVLILEVRTRSTEPVSFEVEGTLRADGHSSTLALTADRATAASPARVRVPLSAFGMGLGGSGSLRLEVRAIDAQGRSDRSYAPRVLLRRDAAGTLLASTTHGPGPYTFTGGAGQLGGFTGPGDVTLPPSDGLWHFCFQWEITAVDSGYGEDFHASNEPVRARGARVKVSRSGSTLFDGYANENACVSFASTAVSGFEVTVRSEAKLGGHTMRAYLPKVNNVEKLGEWSFTVDPLIPPQYVTHTIDSGDQQIAANLIAFSSHTVHQIVSNTTGNLFPAGAVDLHSYVLPGPLCSEGCRSGSGIYLKPEVTDEKFGVSHEVGHWLHGRLTAENPGYGSYNDDEPGETPCSYHAADGPGGHAMRSREYEAAAFTEGFGHFIAALAWNDHETTDGRFRYYKDIKTPAYADLAAVSWIVDLSPGGDIPIGGTPDWYHSECALTTNGLARSVEMDWLRFFWNLRTDAPSDFNGHSPRPTHEALFRLIQLTRTAHPWMNGTGVYAAHTTTLNEGNIAIAQARWLGCADQFGVVQP